MQTFPPITFPPPHKSSQNHPTHHIQSVIRPKNLDSEASSSSSFTNLNSRKADSSRTSAAPQNLQTIQIIYSNSPQRGHTNSNRCVIEPLGEPPAEK